MSWPCDSNGPSVNRKKLVFEISQLCDGAIEAQIAHLEERSVGYQKELSGVPCRVHEQFVLRAEHETQKTIGELQNVLRERKVPAEKQEKKLSSKC